MEAKELRIGNFATRKRIIYEDNSFKTITVSYHDIEACSRNQKHFEPIPLTEEWLEKFGFTEAMYDYTVHTGEFYNNKIGLLKIVGGDKYQLSIGSKNLMVVIEYVHQLQNLYFALTGEELTLK